MENGWFYIAMAGLLLQRGAELILARRHADWIRQQGGYEVGRSHYPLVVGVHLLFIAALFLEVTQGRAEPPHWWPVPFALFMMAQVLRIWSIHSLGPYWNTRILVVPGRSPVVSGPYRYLRHPNYLVVVVELLTLPTAFGAYFTAIFLSVLNLFVLLKFRIPAEEQVLMTETPYGEEMEGRKRWLPRLRQK